MKMMTDEGIKVLDGSACERDGVGFAGTKGFVGSFGRGVLTALREPEIKTFVRASIDVARSSFSASSMEARTPLGVKGEHQNPHPSKAWMGHPRT